MQFAAGCPPSPTYLLMEEVFLNDLHSLVILFLARLFLHSCVVCGASPCYFLWIVQYAVFVDYITSTNLMEFFN